MGSKRTDTRRWITEEDLRTWPTAQVLALPAEVAADYERKVTAIKQYVAGASIKSISSISGISRQYLYYLIDRCQMPDVDERCVGFRALLKGKHLPKPRRSSSEKLTAGRALPGALQALFARYPQLGKTMFDLIVNRRMPDSPRINRRLTWAMIHEIFEDQCTKLGIHPPNYPFSSDSTGFVALARWGRKLRRERQRMSDLADAIDASENVLNPLVNPPSRCYERVECDGHYLDLNWIIEVPGLKGEGVVQIKVTRLWLIALLEVKSSAVIGYSVALNYMNYSAADVARAVRSSLVPWIPRQLSISTIAYKPGECLPNALDPRLSFVCFDELWLDNAKSHLSALFLSVLERTVNAVPVFGPRDAPNVRPNIEMIFDLIEEAGIHPLDGTTGSNTKDPRKAKKKKDDPYLLKLEVVLDLIDLLVVRFNTGIAPGTTISRLEVLRRSVERETTVLRRLPLSQREDCLQYDLYEIAVIGVNRGKPVLRWRDARYFGTGLLSRAGLIGQEVLVMANSLDLRKISVSLSADGTDLGILEVELRWRSTPHTLWTRSQVRKAMTNSGFLRHAADIPREMRRYAEQEAKKNVRSKRLLAQLVAEQQSPSRSPAPKLGSSNPKDDRYSSIEEPIWTKGAPVRLPSIDKDQVAEKFGSDNEFDELLKRLGSVYR